MKKFKYLFAVSLALCTVHTVVALDIQYVSIRGIDGKNVLVEQYGIEKKKNYLCRIDTRACTTTKKTYLIPAKKDTFTLSPSIDQELDAKGATHRTYSPSHTYLAYYIGGDDVHPMRSYVLRNLQTNQEYTIASGLSYWDLVADENRIFEFSPNEKTLLYVDDKDGMYSLYRVDLTRVSSGALPSTKLELPVANIVDFIYYDNETLFYVANTTDSPYNWSLYKHTQVDGKDIKIQSYLSYTDTIKKAGDTILFIKQQAKGYGPELYNVKSKKLSSFSIPGINTKSTISHQLIIKENNATGVLMTPTTVRKGKTYPLVIWLHGGPLRQTSFGYHSYHSYGIYDSILELLRKNNVYVLKLDYRGSYGFGRAYSESIKGSVGRGDIEDIMNAVSYMKGSYPIDRVHLAGNSYGGYMSLKGVAEHPEVFTGVFSINGVTDWESLLVKMQTSIFNTQFNGLPSDTNRALYNQASIINKISNIGTQKIQIVQGQADRTIAPWQADLLYEKLKAEKKNVSIVKYKGEDHVFKQKKTISDLCTRMFTFVGLPASKECK